MPQPLAVLNDEEMHWLGDLGLPNQRRWLNHRNSVTNTAERFPPPRRIVAKNLTTKKHITHKNRSTETEAEKPLRNQLRVSIFCALCAFSWLTEAEFPGSALFLFEAGTHLQEAIEHLRTLSAASGELGVGLFVHVLQAMKFVSDV